MKEEERDAFQFLFNANDKEKHFDSQGYHLELKPVPSCWPLHCNTAMIVNQKNRIVKVLIRENTYMYKCRQLDENRTGSRRPEEVQGRSHLDLTKCKVSGS